MIRARPTTGWASIPHPTRRALRPVPGVSRPILHPGGVATGERPAAAERSEAWSGERAVAPEQAKRVLVGARARG